MAAFSSFQQQPFILDSLLFLPNNNPSPSPSTIISNLDDPNNPFPILDQIEIPHQDHDQISTKGPSSVLSVTNKNITTMDSSSTVVAHHKYDDVTHKRKSQEGNSPRSKEKKGKKQSKKMKKNGDEEKKDSATAGYIHVRARRGQATDSHSLAERVRREKISERMKLLQALVPGCDKVTGKAPMLDEIINYIQSLQYQTEFLSMRLASLSPTYYDFGTDLESLMVRPDKDLSNLPSPVTLPSMEACSPTTAIDNYRRLLDDYANSLLLQQAQMPDVLPQAASRQNLWEVDELRQRYINESGIQHHQHVFFPLI